MRNQRNENQTGNSKKYQKPYSVMRIWLFLFFAVLLVIAAFLYLKPGPSNNQTAKSEKNKATFWVAPDESEIPQGNAGDEIRYGKELLAHTSRYFGPKGTIAAISNGMNCQNCHLEAGRKPFGLNYAAVSTAYPRFQSRSNAVISIAGRINGCFERSMNGKKLDTSSREMKAMIAYFKWIGKDVRKGEKPGNSGLRKLKSMDVAADPVKGKAVFLRYCQACHGSDGQGRLNDDGTEYIYPPLWGKHSYNDGAGLYRLSNFSGFVKNNMPFGVTYKQPLLSDEEAWNVAAFVNSQPRPHKDQSADWKNIKLKPFDFPFGPYADTFTENQHKYGPFGPLASKKQIK